MKFYGGKRRGSIHSHEAHRAAAQQPVNRTIPQDDYIPIDFEETEKNAKKGRRGLKVLIIIMAILLALILALLVYAIRYVKPPTGGNAGGLSTTTASTTTTATTVAGEDSQTTTAATDTTTQASGSTADDVEKTEDELLEELAAMATDIDVSGEKQREGFFTILIVGTDIDGIRTDTIVMATLDTQNKTVAMLNVPRDTMSKDANGKIHKINSAYGKGIERTKKEVTNLLGYDANRYVIVDYDAFENLINAVGGVEIDVPRRMYYRDPDQDLTIDLQPGLQVLDGENALDYMRFRKGYANQDLGRIEAQQGVYKALIKQLATPKTLLKIPALAEVFFENVKTDLSIGEIIWLGTQFYDMDTANIVTETIPTYLRMYNSQSYVVASTYKMLSLINKSFNPYESDIKNVSVVAPPATTKATTEATQEPDESTGSAGEAGESGSSEIPEWLGGGSTTTASGSDVPAATTGPVATTAGVVDIPADTTAAQTTASGGQGGSDDNSTPPEWLS